MAAQHDPSAQEYCVRDWRWADALRAQKDYLRLKFDVFVDELGFTGIPNRDGLAQPDRFDLAGRFVTVETTAGETIGIGRLNCADDADALPTAGAFPELKTRPLRRLDPPLRIAAVTNVALLPPYRGIPAQVMRGRGIHSRVSDLLMQRIIALAVQSRVDVLVLLTRPGTRAEGLFARFGFRCSSQRYRYEKLGLEANRWLARTGAAVAAADRIFGQANELMGPGADPEGSEHEQCISEILRDLWPAHVAGN
jgi:hypothetical protein